jgi:hypothetical protein
MTMRASQAIETATDLLRKELDDDVAEAIIGDTDPFEAAARALGHTADNADDLAAILTQVIEGIDDRAADWLVSSADSPGAWFYRQIQYYL